MRSQNFSRKSVCQPVAGKMQPNKTVGILALQGCVDPHIPHVEACGCNVRAVKTKSEIEGVDALILPGGESTTMLKLINVFGLWDVLKQAFQDKPVWGICAGSILLASEVVNPSQESFGMVDCTIIRNGYGRQLDSHIVEYQDYPVSFIRAPVIQSVGQGVDVLWESEGKPVWVRQGNIMLTTFHPEMTLEVPSPMHRYFSDVMAEAIVPASSMGA